MIAQTIYNTLRANGLTEGAALGMLGNWQCESGLEPNRVQGDFSPYRTASKDYTARIMNGQISRETFGRDGKGYGLYQLTYFSRKLGYWDFWKMSGGAVDDPMLQTEFAILELKTDYPKLLEQLKTEVDLWTCTKLICEQFERPAVNNIDARFAAAVEIAGTLDINAPVASEDEAWEKIPATDYWPPRMLCEGMDGKDVVALRGLLYAHGWDVDVDDDWFDKLLRDRVLDFQDAYGLDADGIVGPKTWAKLTDRG